MPITPKKFYGQHFLRDQSVLDTIVKEADVHPGEVVLEIGPGEGVLTERLAQAGARVVAVEVDDEAVAVLQKRFANTPAVRIVHGDILRLSSEQLWEWLGMVAPSTRSSVARGEPRGPQVLQKSVLTVSQDIRSVQEGTSLTSQTSSTTWKLIANIPYNITGQLFRRFLIGEDETCLPSCAVLLIQKEVADRALAGVGDMNPLALGVQIAGKGRRVCVVPPGAFVPPPAVQSAVFAWERFSVGPTSVSAEEVLDFAKPAFLAPRKKMSNTLAPSCGGAEAFMRLCEQAGVSSDARPEALSVQEWEKMFSLSVIASLRSRSS